MSGDSKRVTEEQTPRDELCSDCPPIGYPTDKTRCLPCPRRVAPASQKEAGTFQDRVQPWMMACFGPEISADRVERGDRFLEEVFELLQSGGYDPARVLPLRDYVWGREVGEPSQEAGGVKVTFAAYCLAHGLDMDAAGETELARIWTKVEKIRAKQAAKPTGSALPVAVPAPAVEPVAWRSRGPKGGWIYRDEKPKGCPSEPVYLRSALHPSPTPVSAPVGVVEALKAAQERFAQIDCALIGQTQNTTPQELLDWCKCIASHGFDATSKALRSPAVEGK